MPPECGHCGKPSWPHFSIVSQDGVYVGSVCGDCYKLYTEIHPICKINELLFSAYSKRKEANDIEAEVKALEERFFKEFLAPCNGSYTDEREV